MFSMERVLLLTKICFEDLLNLNVFKKDFTKFYTSFMKGNDSPFDIQILDPSEKKKIQCYISDKDYSSIEEPDFTSWFSVYDEGLYFDYTNVRTI